MRCWVDEKVEHGFFTLHDDQIITKIRRCFEYTVSLIRCNALQTKWKCDVLLIDIMKMTLDLVMKINLMPSRLLNRCLITAWWSSLVKLVVCLEGQLSCESVEPTPVLWPWCLIKDHLTSQTKLMFINRASPLLDPSLHNIPGQPWCDVELMRKLSMVSSKIMMTKSSPKNHVVFSLMCHLFDATLCKPSETVRFCWSTS